MNMKFNWGTGIALVYIVFAGSMIGFAVVASRQHYDLVSTHYYDDAVNYQDKIDAEKNAAFYTGISVEYLNRENKIEITGIERSEIFSGKISFYKPDKAADDFTTHFELSLTGNVSIPIKKLSHGSWKIIAQWKQGGKKYLIEKNIFVK